MVINIKDIGAESAAKIMTDVALIFQHSAEQDDLPTELYAGAFELIAALADAIKQEKAVTA